MDDTPETANSVIGIIGFNIGWMWRERTSRRRRNAYARRLLQEKGVEIRWQKLAEAARAQRPMVSVESLRAGA